MQKRAEMVVFKMIGDSERDKGQFQSIYDAKSIFEIFTAFSLQLKTQLLDCITPYPQLIFSLFMMYSKDENLNLIY